MKKYNHVSQKMIYKMKVKWKNEKNDLESLLKILSFATSHYATSMLLVVICNYLGHVCNYKFGIV